MSFAHAKPNNAGLNFNFQPIHSLWPVSLQQLQRKKQKQQQYRLDLQKQIEQKRKLKSSHVQSKFQSRMARQKHISNQLKIHKIQIPANDFQAQTSNQKNQQIFKTNTNFFNQRPIQSRRQNRYASQIKYDKKIQNNYAYRYLDDFSNQQKPGWLNMNNPQQSRNKPYKIRMKTQSDAALNADLKSYEFDLSIQKRKAQQQDILDEKINQIYGQLSASIVNLNIQYEIKKLREKINYKRIKTQIDEQQQPFFQAPSCYYYSQYY